MPPDLRNHLDPTGIDTPTSAAASSLDSPAAIEAQKQTKSSRLATGGRPGDVNVFRPAPSERLLFAAIATSCFRMLQRPVATALQPAVGVVDQTATMSGAAIMRGLFKGIQNKGRVRGAAGAPAYDPPCENVDDRAMETPLVRVTMARGHANEACPSRDASKIRDPKDVGCPIVGKTISQIVF